MSSVSQNSLATNSSAVNIDREEPLRFHLCHGHNVAVSADGSKAVRSSSQVEQTSAIIASNRALRDNELFEVRVGLVDYHCNSTFEIGTFLSAFIVHRCCVTVAIALALLS